MSETIRVALLGAGGQMGRETARAVIGADDMDLVGACDTACAGAPVSDITGVPDIRLTVACDFSEMLSECSPHVLVDFAKPFDLARIRSAVEAGVVPVIGSTGQTPDDLKELENMSRTSGVGVLVVPNFAIGAVLMMRFAAEAARYMPNVEIIELHHDRKADAPSGTSIKTAEMIQSARAAADVRPARPAGADCAARGDNRADVHIHSVRLPGLVAHQEVILGGVGQTLTIRHDSLDRTSFMPGVLMAVRRAREIKGFVYGLENLL